MMKNFELNNWIEFVRGAFPKFNPLSSQLMMEAWQEVLKYATLDQAKLAVRQYILEISSKYEPQPKDIKELLKANKPNVIDLTIKEEKKCELDYDLRYQKLDKEQGNMHWLVPHYQEVWREIQQGKYPFVRDCRSPSHEEFREAMKRYAQNKWGRWYFCESENDIKAMTPEQQEALRQRCLETMPMMNNIFKRFN
jgi:hypothetical protein